MVELDHDLRRRKGPAKLFFSASAATVNVSRGMLEFRADPESQFHDTAFQKDKTVLLHCGSGGRAALAGKTLQDMGYTAVFNIGGFKDLAEAGIDTSERSRCPAHTQAR